MSGDEKMLNTFIQDFRKEFMKIPPEEIAYPRSVNGLRNGQIVQIYLRKEHLFMSRVRYCIIIY